MIRHGTPMKARIDKRLTEKGARKRYEIKFSEEGDIPEEEDRVRAHPVLCEALDKLAAEPENEAEIVAEFWATVTAEGFDYNGPNEEN